MFNSKNCGPLPAVDSETATIRAEKLAQLDTEAKQYQLADGEALRKGTTDRLKITSDRAADLIFSAFHQTDPSWWKEAAGLTLSDLDGVGRANEGRGTSTSSVFECLECGATYASPLGIEPGGMGCRRCNQ